MVIPGIKSEIQMYHSLGSPGVVPPPLAGPSHNVAQPICDTSVAEQGGHQRVETTGINIELPSFAKDSPNITEPSSDHMMTRYERAIIITVPSFPKINALDAWRTAVCRALASASGYVDNQ